jgi:hypothetical protein
MKQRMLKKMYATLVNEQDWAGHFDHRRAHKASYPTASAQTDAAKCFKLAWGGSKQHCTTEIAKHISWHL